MNERIKELANQAFIITTDGKIGHANTYMVEKFAELIVKDYAQQLVQANMSNIWYIQAMDEYYEKKWAHRFD